MIRRFPSLHCTLTEGRDAVVPPSDGGYLNFTTAEGTNALENLTTGVANTLRKWPRWISSLVVHDDDGQIYTVRYEATNAMLLNEFLKAHRKDQEQQAAIARLTSTAAKQKETIAELKSIIAQQQRLTEAVTARLNEQTAQIQRVTAQLELSMPAGKLADQNP